jgi:hypothetical protein
VKWCCQAVLRTNNCGLPQGVAASGVEGGICAMSVLSREDQRESWGKWTRTGARNYNG